MKIKNIIVSALVLFGFTSFSGIANAACGKISIANMNWASANFMAEVDKIILEKGYGCEVELVPGATMPTFTSMQEKGEPDIAPEFWANAAIVELEKAVSEGKLHSINKAPITGLGEGWWVSPSVAKKHPELKTVLDIIERPDLFPHPEDSSKGGMMTCPAGWNDIMTPQMDVEIPYSSACMEILLPSLNLRSGSDDLLQRYFSEPRRA